MTEVLGPIAGSMSLLRMLIVIRPVDLTMTFVNIFGRLCSARASVRKYVMD